MKLEIHVHVHNGVADKVLERLELVQGDLATVQHAIGNLASEVFNLKETHMTAFSRLEKALETQTTVVGGVVTLINRMAAEIRELFPDNAKADALAAGFEARSDALAAAIAVGTAAADESDAAQAGTVEPPPDVEPAPSPNPAPTPDPEPEGASTSSSSAGPADVIK